MATREKAKLKKGDWVRATDPYVAQHWNQYWAERSGVTADQDTPFKIADVGAAGNNICAGSTTSGPYWSDGKLEPWAPRVGERVRAMRNTVDITKGNEYEVIDADDSDQPARVIDDAGDPWWLVLKDIEPVAGKVAADSPDAGRKFKAGDRVQVTDLDAFDESRVSLGSVATVESADGKFIKLGFAKPFGGAFIQYARPEQIELVDAPATAPDAPKFKVGDRVRVSGDPYHLEISARRGVIASSSPARGDWTVHLDGYGELNFFESEMEIELAPAPLKLEAGKFYMTRDGRKVGPMQIFNENFIEVIGDGRLRDVHGVGKNEANGEDLIAEAPTTTAQLGTAIVCLIRDGKPLPASDPYVHDDQESANTEMRHLADLHKGDTFGVYKLVASVTSQKPAYDHEWQRLAAAGQKIQAIVALRRITGLGLKATRDAVEDWLDRAN